MTILYLITRAEIGGAQVHVLDLLTNLPSGFKAVVATGEAGFLCDQAAGRGISVRHVPDLVQKMHPIKDLKALVSIVRLIRDESPVLVHAHTSKAGLLARLAGRITRTPVVFTAHTWSFADGLPALQRFLAVPLERFAAWGGGKIITVSKSNRDAALQKSISREADLVTIWNGIPDVPYRAHPGTNEIVTLFMTARFAPQKDHALLLEALIGIEANWRLWLLGDGPTRSEIEQLVIQLGLQNRVHFLGARSDAPQLLAAADVFVLSTKWEGLPLSILEAMRAGLPVIASNVGGVAEAVTDGATGYLVEPGDAAMLRARIQAMFTSRDLMSTMGSAGRRRYDQDFRIDKMIHKTLAVYRESVAGGKIDHLFEKIDLLET